MQLFNCLVFIIGVFCHCLYISVLNDLHFLDCERFINFCNRYICSASFAKAILVCVKNFIFFAKSLKNIVKNSFKNFMGELNGSLWDFCVLPWLRYFIIIIPFLKIIGKYPIERVAFSISLYFVIAISGMFINF